MGCWTLVCCEANASGGLSLTAGGARQPRHCHAAPATGGDLRSGAPAVEQTLTGIAGIAHAYVHGSWAARFHGETGKSPGDVDVLIVGQPDRGTVDAALDGLEGQLGREVNVTHVSPQRWAGTDDPFVIAVRSRPLVELDVARQVEAMAS